MADGTRTPTAGIEALARELERDAGVAAAFLFGSAARGGLRRDSDVDVGVIYAGGAEEGTSVGADRLGRFGLAAGRDVHLVDLDRADHASCASRSSGTVGCCSTATRAGPRA